MKLHALLSKRETQVAELLAWGASKKEVASKLFVSTRTVEKLHGTYTQNWEYRRLRNCAYGGFAQSAEYP